MPLGAELSGGQGSPKGGTLKPVSQGSSISNRWLAGTGRRSHAALCLTVAAIGVAMAQAGAQAPSQRPSGEAVIQGTVQDSTGKRIDGAAVHLEKPGEGARDATTDAAGVFTLHSLALGTYTLRAEKSGLRSKPSLVIIVMPAEQERVDLVIEDGAKTQAGSSPAKPPSALAMEFADKPDFTVAGVTDWSAAGGHGSDTSLRTSEALARETLTLRPDSTEQGVSDSPRPHSADAGSESELQKALAAAPGSFAANRALGMFYLNQGNYRAAIPPLDASWQIDPANDDNEYELALALKRAGDVAISRQHVEKLLTHHDTADLHRLAGELDEAAGDPLAAVHEFERAARLDPNELNYFEWGSELLLHRAVLQAEDVFRTGTQSFPNSVRLLTALGSALFAAAKYDEAAESLCHASDLDPASSDPYLFMGKIQTAAPSPLPCIEVRLERFAAAEPDNSLANYFYAMAVWKERGQPADPAAWQQAAALLKKAVAIDVKCADAYLQLGILYSLQNSYENAIDNYSKAIGANPGLAEAHYRLGVAYDRIGELAKAKREFQLHDELKQQQAAEVERERRAVKQFLVAGQPTYPVAH